MTPEQPAITLLGPATSDLLNKIISDIKSVFSIVVGKEDLTHFPMMPAPVPYSEEFVTAMVGIAGTYSGVVSLLTPKKLALDFASGMLGTVMTELDIDVHDALGEITNMIAGSFKQHLSRSGTEMRLSIPSIFAGKICGTPNGTIEDTLKICFGINEHCFQIHAFLKGVRWGSMNSVAI